jgi:hypothetical protein
MWNVVPDVPQAQPRARESNRLLTAPVHKGRPIDPVVEERLDRRPVELERRQGFDRMHAEAGRRLRLMKAGSPVP